MQNLSPSTVVPTTIENVTEQELLAIDGGNLYTDAAGLYVGVVALACPPLAVPLGVIAVGLCAYSMIAD